MNARQNLSALAEEFRDEAEFTRRQRAREVATFDLEAHAAGFDAHADVNYAVRQIEQIASQICPADALTLLHAVWKRATQNSNQHLDLWKGFNEDIESAMNCLIDELAVERVEAGL